MRFSIGECLPQGTGHLFDYAEDAVHWAPPNPEQIT